MSTAFNYTHIPGWFNFETVYDRAVRDAPDPAVFVEVGAWLGKSSAYLASAVRSSGKQIRLVMVDTWVGSELEPAHQQFINSLGGDAFATFQSNMERASVWELIEPLRKSSVEAAAGFENESVNFVFLDGGHDYWSVTADIRAWWPKVRSGGWLGGHDYGTWVGVTRAVDDLLGPVEVVREATSWLIRKDPARPLRNITLLPKVGVVTPHYATHPAHFRQCVLSVRRQSIPCIHYVVSDGDEPVWPDHPRDTRLVRIPGPHRDTGNAARAVGGTLAAAEGCDAVAFLDADNWFEPDHIESLLNVHRSSGAVVCSSGRKLYTLDGRLMGHCPEVDGEKFVDTSCLFLLRAAFGLIAYWAAVPPEQSAIGDRIFWTRVKQSKMPRIHTSRNTLAFRTQYASHYQHFGLPIPVGSKILVRDGSRTIVRLMSQEPVEGSSRTTSTGPITGHAGGDSPSQIKLADLRHSKPEKKP
jgi:hypothetical protein